MNCSSVCSPRRKLAGLGVEVVELPLEDRDHVPGDVLVDLRVLERAELALAVLLLGRVLLEGGRVDGLLRLRRAVGGGALLLGGGDGLHGNRPFLSST